MNQLLLKKLTINNLLSHRNTEIDFSENCRILIDGKSGAGKSSIIDSIIWALYNKSRSNNKSLIRSKSKTATVELTLSRGGDEYKIVRTVTSSGKHELEVFCNGAPAIAAGIRGLQDYIENVILHSSYELFVNSIAYPQDNVDNFVKQSQSKRKDILLEILRTSSFDDLLIKTKTLLSATNDAEAYLRGQIEWNKNLCKKNSGTYGSIHDIEEKIEELKSLESTYEIKTKESVENDAKHNEGLVRLATVGEKIRSLLEREKAVEATIKQMSSYDWVDQDALVNGKREAKMLVEYLVSLAGLARISERITQEEENLKILSKCVFCGKTNPDAEKKIQKVLEELYSEAKKLEATERVENKEGLSLTQANGKLEKILSAELNLSLMRKMMPSVDDCNKQIIEIRNEINNLKDEEASLTDVTTRHIQTKNDWPTLLQNVKSELASLEYAENLWIETVKLDDKLRDTQNIQDHLELLKDALGPNGIKAIVTEMVLPSLEEKINSVLSTLSDMRIRLETERGNSKEDGTVDGLFIYLINESGDEMEISNYSGGERTKIVVAISEGLASMQNIGFRMMDENVVGLDNETVDSFVRVINSVKNSFSQLLCISHLSQVKELFSERLNVIKLNGTSQVE